MIPDKRRKAKFMQDALRRTIQRAPIQRAKVNLLTLKFLMLTPLVLRPRPMSFGSIRTRIMVATTWLIVAIVGTVVWLGAKAEIEIYSQQKKYQAKSFAVLLSQSTSDSLNEQNWGALRISLYALMKDNPDFVYLLVSDARLEDQIVAASQEELQQQYIPDIVPLWVTEKALKASQQPRAVETFLLRDIQFPSGIRRAQQGERIFEAAADIRTNTGVRIGNLRLGVSLQQVDRAVEIAVQKALLVGAIALGFGLAGAYLLAMQLTKPLQRLQASAAKIAAGDLHHRAEIHLADEIGALAIAFNEMSAALQSSFSRLHKTVEAFERFVPNKFLAAIAPEGIENIQVGVASTRIMTVLFCDIRGYTSMSEDMTPLETFLLLNDYLAYMGRAIEDAGGFIDKYIGDAIMALFDDVETDGALQAAIAMQQTLAEFNRVRSQQNLPAIEVGIGIHRGEVVMGTVGFTSRIESTVIGDTVNVAARVEGLTRSYNCPILVTKSVVMALRRLHLFQLSLVDQSVKIKGKDEAIAIYELQF